MRFEIYENSYSSDRDINCLAVCVISFLHASRQSSKAGFWPPDIPSKCLHNTISNEPNLGGCQKLLSWFFPLRVGGVPPHSAKEKIRYKTAIFGQKALILALLDLFLMEIFGDFPLRGEGVPPISARFFLAQCFSPEGWGGGDPLSGKTFCQKKPFRNGGYPLSP